MYLPPQFHSHDPAHARALMREHPLASLVSTDDEGFPFVTHLPLHAQERGDTLVLLGHCARPNPHWRYLQARREALVTFMGPQAYLSPSVYPRRILFLTSLTSFGINSSIVLIISSGA